MTKEKLCEICKEEIEENRDICDYCINQVLKKSKIGEEKRGLRL